MILPSANESHKMERLLGVLLVVVHGFDPFLFQFWVKQE
jgi:hypothetical protein